MSNDNILEFKPKQTKQPVEDCANVNYTFTVDGMEFSFTPEGLDRMVEDMVMQDVQLDQLADACFELQCLVEENPELAQFVTKNLKNLTKNMQNRLTTP
jgi:hypothetical protein